MVSDEYIRMCKEATEIQEAWDPKEGDLIVWDFDGNFKQDLLRLKKASKQDLQDLDVFWLPRQEDLQKIILKNSEKEWHMVFIEFKDWFILSILLPNQVSMFNDLTELWLSFVMETCFDKTWNGNRWVKL